MTSGQPGPFFQPIVGTAAGELRGFEMLSRWRNPDEGLLPPASPRVIEEACDQAALWLALTGSLVPVSVNVSPMELSAPDFCDHVGRCLAGYGLPVAALELELTENALVVHRAKAHAALVRLRDLGVRVRIDDFGAGSWALMHLHELPVGGIKLHRSWLTRRDDPAHWHEAGRAVVAGAHHLGMDVVAEGIETASQLERARELGCDLAEGFGFSRPLSAEQAIRYARRHAALFDAGRESAAAEEGMTALT